MFLHNWFRTSLKCEKYCACLVCTFLLLETILALWVPEVLILTYSFFTEVHGTVRGETSIGTRYPYSEQLPASLPPDVLLHDTCLLPSRWRCLKWVSIWACFCCLLSHFSFSFFLFSFCWLQNVALQKVWE